WPIVATAAGVGLIWRQADESQRARWSASARRPLLGEGDRRIALARLGVGAVLVAAGVGGLLAARDGLQAARHGVFAIVGAVMGVAPATGPAAAEVEEMHATSIDVVAVGDCPIDERLNAVVAAAREAMVNAAKFAGVAQVQVFVEVEGERVTVFVRDRGNGFDPAAVG